MKTNLKIVLCASLMVLMTGLAGAAQVIINNLSGLHPVTDLGGNLVPVGSGFVQLGSIPLADAAVQAMPGDRAGLMAAFEEFGSAVQFGAGGSGGFFSADINSPIDPDSPLVGQNIFIVAGDGADIAGSAGIWIFKSDKLFAADAPDPFATSITLNGALSEGTILVGTPVSAFVPLAGATFDGSQMVAMIPEPGSLLLVGAVGVLAVARRRRCR